MDAQKANAAPHDFLTIAFRDDIKTMLGDDNIKPSKSEKHLTGLCKTLKIDESGNKTVRSIRLQKFKANRELVSNLISRLQIPAQNYECLWTHPEAVALNLIPRPPSMATPVAAAAPALPTASAAAGLHPQPLGEPALPTASAAGVLHPQLPGGQHAGATQTIGQGATPLQQKVNIDRKHLSKGVRRTEEFNIHQSSGAKPEDNPSTQKQEEKQLVRHNTRVPPAKPVKQSVRERHPATPTHGPAQSFQSVFPRQLRRPDNKASSEIVRKHSNFIHNSI